VITAIIIGSTVIAALLLFLAELIPKLMTVLDRLTRPLWLAGLSIAIVVAAAVGYWFRYLVIIRPCYQIGCHSSPGTYAVIGLALNLAPMLAGLLLATLVRRTWLRRTGSGSLPRTGRRSADDTGQASAAPQVPEESGNALASE
jgi:hypothetical protein